MRLSGYARERRWRTVAPYVRGRVLDLGCGYGRLAERLPADQPYVGVDVLPDAIRYSRQRFPQHRFYECDLGNAPLPSDEEPFDTVVMMAVLEHLRSPANALRDVRPHLAADGYLVLTSPSPLGDWVHRVGSRLNLFYPEHVVQHVRIYDRRAMCDLLADSGFDIVTFRHFELGINQLAVCRGR
jgi:SAM-dependent methyltransferase